MANSWHNTQDMIQFHQSQIYLNPTLPSQLQIYLHTLAHSHSSSQPLVWILSSGTNSINQNGYKLIGLTHKAFLTSAQAVNDHLKVTTADAWLNVLPLFHVGGLSILYRSYSATISCHNFWTPDYKWKPKIFVEALQTTKATLTSLVPTQVFDLVSESISAPSQLRAVVVGGAHLNSELYIKARKLGWPLLPSFGMTEAASQIATAKLESLEVNKNTPPPSAPHNPCGAPKLQLLQHINAKTNSNNVLSIKGTSLLEGYYSITPDQSSTWISPKDSDGWYTTQDCAIIEDDDLLLQARVDEILKIRGESVNLAALRTQLETLCQKQNFLFDCTLVALPNTRLGFQLLLVGDAPKEKLTELLSLFNSMVLPYERISHHSGPTTIPKTALGKILYKELAQQLLQMTPN